MNAVMHMNEIASRHARAKPAKRLGESRARIEFGVIGGSPSRIAFWSDCPVGSALGGSPSRIEESGQAIVNLPQAANDSLSSGGRGLNVELHETRIAAAVCCSDLLCLMLSREACRHRATNHRAASSS